MREYFKLYLFMLSLAFAVAASLVLYNYDGKGRDAVVLLFSLLCLVFAVRSIGPVKL